MEEEVTEQKNRDTKLLIDEWNIIQWQVEKCDTHACGVCSACTHNASTHVRTHACAHAHMRT